MPEGVRAYPRWDGRLRTASSAPAVALQEITRALNNQWSRSLLMVVGLYSILYLGSLYTYAQANKGEANPFKDYLDFLGLLRWGALAVAAVVAGPSLLEDQRRGALELYLARAVTRREYLAGKILAVFLLTFAALFLPGLLYWLSTFLFFDKHPAHWGLAPLGALGYSLMWAALVAGLGLGLSCVARTSRGATLLLIGGFATLDIFMSKLLEAITKNHVFQILSPFNAVGRQTEWLFQTPSTLDFPAWWGLLYWAVLLAVGVWLVARRAPRIQGDDRARA